MRLSASVCMATYNGAPFIREQLNSIISQLLPGDELLVSDDGSGDETLGILQEYGAHLKVVGNTRSGGVVRNFERVLTSAQCDIVVLADQDDFWLPGKLDRLRVELQSCDLVMSNALMVDASLRPTSGTLFEQLGATSGVLKNLWRNSFVGCCMGFRRHLLERALPFPSRTPWHDWLLGLLASVVGKVKFVEEPLMLYRRHGSNATDTGARSKNGFGKKLLIRVNLVVALIACVVRRNSVRA